MPLNDQLKTGTFKLNFILKFKFKNATYPETELLLGFKINSNKTSTVCIT